MWWNFIKTTLRALYRDKVYALINIAGLAIGMACCLILGSYLHSELTYDLHNNQHERIYRVAVDYTIDGRTTSSALTSPNLGPILATNFADVQAYVRLRPLAEAGGINDRLIRHGDDAFYWNGVYAADENIFEVFTHHILYGDQTTALASPQSAAVSQTFAEKYFGESNPIGKTITLESGEQRAITLVFADLPKNSHLTYDVLFAYSSLAEPLNDPPQLWGGWDFTYVLMPESYAVSTFDSISDAIFTRYMTDHANYLNGSWKSWLQPLAGIHLNSDVGNDRPTGNRFYLYGIAIIGTFILLIACINYINLATARAARRAREIGMRKILGARRLPLGIQFLSESVLISLVALVVALALFYAALVLTPIDNLLANSLSPAPVIAPTALLLIIGTSIVIGILAGIYPAVYLSSIAPVAALLGTHGRGISSSRFREFLVLVQFSISITVIASTLIMMSQMNFVADQPLGYDKKDRLVITLHGVDVIEKIPVIRNELEKNIHIVGVTATDRLMGVTELNTFFETESNEGKIKSVTTNMMPVDRNYLPVMGMELVAGRNFLLDEPTDGTIIVNETVVRRMGWEQPIGKHMGRRNRSVIGVVKDFNFSSLHKAVEPIAIYQYRTKFESVPVQERQFVERFLIVHVAKEDLGDTVGFIEKTLKKFDPVHPFQYRFFDEVLNDLYLSEEQQTKLIGTFSVISVFIACLGLLGLTAFATAQRTKEIGIRKVLGASTFQIVMMLSRRVLILIAIGSVIASLIAYLAMDAWLESFALRTRI